MRNLPSSFGRSFATLDEYLEIRPGVYEVVTTIVPRGEPQIVTREQLMRECGFTR